MKNTPWRLSRRAMLGVLGVAPLTSPLAVRAADWPSKPVKIVVAYAAGGLTDSVARVLANGLSKTLGQPFIVENRPGASGLNGSTFVGSSAADGYTLLLNPVGTVISPYIFENVPANLMSRFATVAQVSSVAKVLVVNKRVPANSMSELIDYAKTSKKPLTYGSVGVGSAHHLSGELFSQKTGIQLTHVPYRGSAPALTDLVGEQIDMIFEDLPPALPFIKSEQIKCLAVTSARRSPQLPDMPTMEEAGVSDFVVEPWNGVVAPVQTPEAVIRLLDESIRKVIAGTEFTEKLQSGGVIPSYKGHAAYAAFMKAESERWGQVIQKAGIPKQ